MMKGYIKHHKYIHGESHTRLFNIWQTMLQRCYNPNSRKYPIYGGRGITVFEKWKEYVYFRDWSMKNGYSTNLTIDRVDNEGNYEPLNCRWVDMKTQQRNRRSNHIVTINGTSKCLSEWSEIYGIKPQRINTRINRYGWTEIDAITTPLRGVGKRR